VTAFLLDVSVLIALMWPAHEAHVKVQRWFHRNSQEGWATCPLTEAGFVRIVSNPAFSPDAVTPQEAIKVLAANLKHATHEFWPDDIGFVRAVSVCRAGLAGHQQVTDAYLLGLALHRKGKFATLDRSVLALLPATAPERSFVAIIQ
jgi:uncharacterized protein